jgi:UDP-N-acetylmuramate: L-alanyl-gamma-D-glutamyl-meso-diaminopimelate ligase
MVGAQLEGFDVMVKLTHDNDFIVLEGDEYLSSPIDRRPKFHLYKPNIALLSGIAWDHINVFPTYENYLEQFDIFVDSIVEGGSITYNAEDPEVKKVIDGSVNTIRKFPYQTPEYHVENGMTYIKTNEGPMPIEVFGDHNMNNLAGAKWICLHMGVSEDDFFEAISSFKGASKRLEKIAEGKNSVAYKDFAHSPSKVMATTQAMKEQHPERKLVACLELHTYSSLNPEFLKEYRGALDAADTAVVFYSPHAVKIKKLEAIEEEHIFNAFKRDDLIIFTHPDRFKEYLFSQDFDNSSLLLMSSGNYGGLDFEEIKELFY